MTVLYISGTNFPSDIVLKMLFLFTSASDIVIMINAISLLKISRPGLWLVFVWLYLWPTGGFYTLLHSLKFWMGLLYCTFPLNFLVYGMNDLADEDVDSQNPRKGNFIYGAKITKGQRRNLPLQIALVNITAGCVLGICSNDWVYIFCWTSSAVCINFFYNNEPFRLSRKCPWELPCMIVGHFLIPLLSCRLNQVPFPSFFSWLFNGLLLARSHIWLEFADIDVDKGSDKRTIAVFLGKCTTLRLVVLITLIEASVGFLLLKSTLVCLFSLLGVFVFCTSSAQGAQNKVHVSVSQSLVGVCLMIYVWINRILA